MSEKSDLVSVDHVGFQIDSEVKGAIFNPARPDGINFTVANPHKLTFSLKPKHSDSDGFGRSGLIYKVRCELPATPEIASFIRTLIDGRLDPNRQLAIELPLVIDNETLIEQDGTIAPGFLVPKELLPTEAQTLLEEAEIILVTARDRFLTLLRWSQGAEAADKLVDSSNLYWRVDPGLYYSVPQNLSAPRSARALRRGFQWGQDYETAMTQLWPRDVQESLAHEMIREAQTLVQQSPRSALLIAASAAEAGVKQHLSKVAPHAAWLLENSPSPPVFKMLRDYLPAVNTAAGRNVGFWEALKPTLKAIEILFQTRNTLAHTGLMPTDVDVQAAVDTVRDLLYVLDVVEGESWAKLLVDPSLAAQLAWPARDEGSRPIFVTMSNPRHEAIRRLLGLG